MNRAAFIVLFTAGLVVAALAFVVSDAVRQVAAAGGAVTWDASVSVVWGE